MLRQVGSIELPDHNKAGGFDHADIHHGSGRLYVAHTANDTLDVIDCVADRYLHSIPDLTGIAGVLVSEEHNLVFTSNRGENTVAIFCPDDEAGITKVNVGVRPNGMAYDPGRNLLLAANVGDPAGTSSLTASIIDTRERRMTASVPLPGRTRWAIFDSRAEDFYVNVNEPAQIAVIQALDPSQVARVWQIPVAGPHGLGWDAENGRLFCACDGKKLVTLDISSGDVLNMLDLSGVPDVVFFNAALNHLYVAVGDPGVIEVFDTEAMKQIEAVTTGRGAHTIGFDNERNRVYAFLPQTHSAAVYVDEA